MSSQATDSQTAIRKHAPAPWLLATSALVVLCALAPQTRSAAAQTAASSTSAGRAFNIPAQPLTSALNAFGRQSGLQITLASSTTRGLTSQAVNGSYTPRQALTLMLQGTGLPFSITADRTVVVGQQTSADAGGIGGEGSLVLDTIEVTSVGAANLPYETPGTTNFISGQELERFPGLTSGSIFQGTPGVISGSSNNGAAIDPNIRGLQGMNRVATTIDGSQQSTSTYRGYAGVDNRTYVDPDLISGITVTKGPDGAVGGAIGGTIAMETLNVDDILKPGDTYGVRGRVGLNSNGITPVIDQTGASYGSSDTGNWTGSLAAAVTTPGVDLVAAYVHRKSGNYFSGTHGDLTTADYLGQQQKLSNYGYGQQIYNTSEDVTSGLLKATLRPADGHELQLGYLYYGNEFGEVMPSAIATTVGVTWQLPLSSVEVNQATARYHFDPNDNDLIDLRVNSYLSSVDETNTFALLGATGTIQQQSKNFGVNATNVSRFSVFGTPLALELGGAYTYERAIPSAATEILSGNPLWAMPADGERQVSTLTAKAKWEPLSWLTLEGGLEYINYDTIFLGTVQYGYDGPDFTGYSGSGVSPSASVTVTPLPGWQLYAQYQSGIRPPSLRETSQTRYEQVFNPYLDAEQASNWEFGTNFLKNDWLLPGDKARLKVAYFDNTTNNYVGRAYENWSDMVFFNYDHVRFKGIEISGGYDAGWAFVDFGFNYYTGFEACLKDGECMDYTLQADYLTNQIPPDFTASVTAGMRFWDDRITVGGRLTYMGQRLAPLVPDASYFWVTKLWAPYTIVDLFGQWRINDTMTLDVGVQNLFDAYYVDALNNTDMPAPGRVIRGSLTAKLGGSEPISWLPLGRPASARNMPWTGFYLGAHFGYGFGKIEGTTTPSDGSFNPIAASESADQNPSNMLAGAQTGFTYQLSNGFVLGVEADYSSMNMVDYRNAMATEGQLLIDNHQLQARTDYSFDWLATIRGRIGYAWDRLQIYGTGGVAFLKETETRTQYRSSNATASLPAWRTTDTFFAETSTATRTGFALGGGAEYAIDDHWSLTADYLFTGFGVTDFLFPKARAGVTKGYSVTTVCFANNSTPPCPGGVTTVVRTTYPGTSETINGRDAANSANLQLLKIGVNYRF